MTDFPDNWKCFHCGEPGHLAAACPQAASQEKTSSDRPQWCGECDLETRLIDHKTYMQRCHKCWAWPAKGTRHHQPFPQHRICGGCQNIVYAFEKSPCGKHQPLAIDAAGRRGEVTLAEHETHLIPLVNEPGNLNRMTIRELGAELARLREPYLPPGPMTPERAAALRELALRQLAPSRRPGGGMIP
jgi:Zinc knuckle